MKIEISINMAIKSSLKFFTYMAFVDAHFDELRNHKTTLIKFHHFESFVLGPVLAAHEISEECISYAYI
jgi:hypothetical protein